MPMNEAPVCVYDNIDHKCETAVVFKVYADAHAGGPQWLGACINVPVQDFPPGVTVRDA